MTGLGGEGSAILWMKLRGLGRVVSIESWKLMDAGTQRMWQSRRQAKLNLVG